ncbi:MAG: outer membrane beta-barrel protein [Chitinophagaceae bacterium]|nr:outer membrane beta-barrel protein [Chitinophagaceae bacterium]
MWSDEFDKRINEAAENHLPPFREDDWNRMNVLLDEHLPEEKKKRRFIPLLFLLLGGVSMLIILTTYKQAPVESLNDIDQNINITAKTELTLETQTGDRSPTNEPGHHYPDQSASDKIQQPVINYNSTQKHKTTVSKTEVAKKIQRKSANTRVSSEPEPTREEPATIAVTETPAAPLTTVPSQENPQTSADSSKTVTESRKEEEKKTEEPIKENKKTTSGKGSKWQISFSTGPDLSVIGMSKTGDWKMQYGIGVGYSINERVQLRTGFLISRKLYYADSSDYNPPKGFWDYYPNLQKIDANCLVYEIPLNVVYTFPSAKKHQWFVSGGLSSYLMKQETYAYYYKDPSGQDRYRERTINNENDHILSILHLSGGYQYKLNDKLSLMAEPYMKLPLGGVGFGKVKLNNTGVLFTVGYKPFGGKGK